MSEGFCQHIEVLVAEHGGALADVGHLSDDEVVTAYIRLSDFADPGSHNISINVA